ncbi:MAG TPA: zinc-binding dehydrogenase [Pseudomonadales bacterium]
MSSAMTAARLVKPGRFDLVEIARPQPGPGEVRVALEGCGVCASNLPVWSGRPWFDYPLAPGELGHEGWGRVEAVGPDVDASLIGRRVAMVSSRAYAEADIASADDLIALPESLRLAPLEPFGCAFNVADRARLGAGRTVAVVGLGFIGLAVTRLACAAGCRVATVSSNPHALSIAETMGAFPVSLQEDRHRVRDAVIGALGGCDRVIECTGHQQPLDLATDLIAEGGCLVIAGYHQDGPRYVDLQQWNWKGIDVVNAHERDRRRVRQGMRIAADALAADPWWVDTLITHTYPLTDISAALKCADERPEDFVKAAVLTAVTA